MGLSMPEISSVEQKLQELPSLVRREIQQELLSNDSGSLRSLLQVMKAEIVEEFKSLPRVGEVPELSHDGDRASAKAALRIPGQVEEEPTVALKHRRPQNLTIETKQQFEAKQPRLQLRSLKAAALSPKQNPKQECSAIEAPNDDNQSPDAPHPALASGTEKPVEASTAESGWRRSLARIVDSSAFDYASGALVVLNAVTIGMQTNYMAHSLDDLAPLSYRVADTLFCVCFSLELICRFMAYGLRLFTSGSWGWNIFDCTLVGLQLVDEVISWSAAGVDSGLMNFSFMRVLRILRLIRVLRIVRILRLIGELRAIVSSIVGSLKSLGWTVVLLFVLVYVFGVYFTQIVLDHRLAMKEEGQRLPEDDAMVQYFGSVVLSVQSLYQAITGGVNWADLSDPLVKNLGAGVGFVMCMFIAFAVLCLLNVVTGVFVESALKSAKDDHDKYMLRHVRELFYEADLDESGQIGWTEFQKQLDNKHMLEFFHNIDVDISEAESVFRLMDYDGSGSIDLDEFLNGCLNLKGPAKAIDTSALIFETRSIARQCESILTQVSKLSEAEPVSPPSLPPAMPLTPEGFVCSKKSSFSRAAAGYERRMSRDINNQGWHQRRKSFAG
eukprot:TRINITY_DN78832_c0_g1_i1.p1 TRINITY_DN78832_c0_g1~~TRINITY_DN78832_c0_g1_i1.p1  ORF type:complete len:631 (+),score=132.21 TRINITY_DN78832_c0_g1_i1:58-1893(+)